MPDLFLLMNHRITDLQRAEAIRSLGAERIIELPPALQAVWMQIPPEQEQIRPLLASVCRWLSENARRSDYVLVQGDFGACFLLVTFAFESGLIPVYSTTRREASEEPAQDGTIHLKHRFRHTIFRRYGM